MNVTIVESLRTRLIARKGQYGLISRNHNISYQWLTKFAAGAASNPTQSSIERLETALSMMDQDEAGLVRTD